MTEPVATAGAGKDFEVTNAMVFSIAVPMTLAFLTTPLLGLVDTAVVGRFGDAALIGGLAVGAVTFDLLFTGFNFLRTGTTGFVAQAFGRGDEGEQQAIFWRAIILAVGIGVALLLLSPVVNAVAMRVMDPAADVQQAATTYILIRFVSAPFALVNYAILGYLLGAGRAYATLALQAMINGINIVLSIWLGLGLGFGIAGVAWATVLGEAIIAVAAFFWIWRRFDPQFAPSWARIVERSPFMRLMQVNRDIMIRSFALVTAFFLFARFGTGFGTATLAANAILMNFFLVSAYFLDGLASASEQLAGRAVGANALRAFWQTVRKTSLFGFLLSAVSATVIALFGGVLIDVMTTASQVRLIARDFLWWAALTAPAGVLAFQMDGVYIGATWAKEMRNWMLVSLVAFVVSAWALIPLMGNHGLWLALNLWLVLRGITLFVTIPGKVSRVFTP